MPALEIALIVLLILASIAGIWLTTGRDDEPNVIVPPVATPTTDATPDVPMYRGNPERTGIFLGPGIDGAPVELWRVEVGGQINSAPAIVNGVLYIGAGDGGVYAYDTDTGEQVWVFQGSSPIQSSPAVQSGVVYAGSEDGTLYALNAADGSELWSFPGARADAAPVVVGNALYTGSGDGFLYALDTATGEEFWRAPLNEAASRSPAVADGVVYIGSADGVLHTFDAETGEPGWARQLEGANVATTAIADGIVYQNTFGGDVNHAYALHVPTGAELWRFDAPSGQDSGFLPPAVGNGVVYLPSQDHMVYAVDAATGELVWQFETGGSVEAAPALVGDTLYVAGLDQHVYALDAMTGVERWRFVVEGGANFGPVVTGGVAYVGTEFGYLYAIGGTGEDIATPAEVAGLIPATPEASPAEVPATPVASSAASAEFAAFLWQVGQDDGLGQPTDVTVAPDGTVWIVDSDTDALHQFDPGGTLLAVHALNDLIGGGTVQAEASTPGALAFDSTGNAFVLDLDNRRVLKFGPDWSFVLEWGSHGTGDGQFLNPSDLAVDSQGSVYVNDWSRSDVQKFDSNGTWLATTGAAGTGEAEFSGYLARIGVDAGDNLYVPNESRVLVFAPDGSFLRSFGDGLGFAVDAVVDLEGRVYVSDGENSQVQIYDPTGNLIGSWGTFGQNPGMFIEVDALALDGSGNIHVVDFVNRRVQAFALTIPEPGATPVATPAT
jgi:outer membrane protein assembly factor BamB